MPETTPKMRPEDVPSEWVALAKDADVARLHRQLQTSGPGARGARPTSDLQTACIIAAVYPLIATAERAKVAEEARAYAEGHLPVVRAILHAFASRITTRREQT